MQRLGPPHWPAYPPGLPMARSTIDDPEQGLRRRARRPADRRRSCMRSGYDVDCLPLADVPVAGHRCDRRSRLRHATRTRSRRSPAPSPKACRWRRAAGAQAPAGTRPRDRRQPSQAAGGRYRPRDSGGKRFRRLSPARQASARDDRTCCVYRDRRRRTGHDFGAMVSRR